MHIAKFTLINCDIKLKIIFDNNPVKQIYKQNADIEHYTLKKVT